MKPLILKYAEIPEFKELDYSLIEYSRKQNLSVLKGTETPAVLQASMETETFTRISGEPTDSDKDYLIKLQSLMDTFTRTLSNSETTDSDFGHQSIYSLMDTTTRTKMNEVSDSDR